MADAMMAVVTPPPGVPPPPGAKGQGKGPPPAPSKGKGKGKPAPNNPPAVSGWHEAVLCGGRRMTTLESGTHCLFFADNKRWRSIDQYCEAMKFASEEMQEKVRGCKLPTQMQAVGEDSYCDYVADYRPLEVMYLAAHARFTQDVAAREELLNTCGSELQNPNDNCWHKQTMKAHWYRKVLQRLREEMRGATERDQAVLEHLRREFSPNNFDEVAVAQRCESTKEEAEKLQNPIDLQVSTMSGTSFTVSVLPFDEGCYLKEKVGEALQIYTLSRLQLLKDGEPLRSSRTMLELGIQDGDEIMVIIKGSPLESQAGWNDVLEQIRIRREQRT
eukprot:TRINITY_DN19654_c0_g1_i1.p1 TRINITY_DN19654_c0_g1~~TRINITY_DN19654_c0_g1_i1.p1  ORF type:complete len:355 (-),score=53.17 TRINITY_DN19654_c0_g1_i1:241-1233(-)